MGEEIDVAGAERAGMEELDGFMEDVSGVSGVRVVGPRVGWLRVKVDWLARSLGVGGMFRYPDIRSMGVEDREAVVRKVVEMVSKAEGDRRAELKAWAGDMGYDVEYLGSGGVVWGRGADGVDRKADAPIVTEDGDGVEG